MNRFRLLFCSLLAAALLPAAGLAWDTTNLYTTGEISLTTAVPEPASMSMMMGCLLLGLCRRRRAGRMA